MKSRGEFFGEPIPGDDGGECTGDLPPVPKASIRGNAHLEDAEEKTKRNAIAGFRSYRPSRSLIKRAKQMLKRAQRSIASRQATLKRDNDRRDRLSPVYSRCQTSWRDVATFSNLPALAGLVGCGVVTFGLFAVEVLSATLQMVNSGWGLAESVPVTALIMITWVVQPFLATKFAVSALPSDLARWFDFAVAMVGVPLGVVGIWVVATTLGPMAEAPEFSMMLTELPEPPEATSKTVYVITGMFSMWFGSYSAFYFFKRFLDQLWPVTAVERSDYEVLSKRIKATEEEIANLEDQVIAAEHEIATQEFLERRYVAECLSCLHEAQSELQGLRQAIRLPVALAAPSEN